MDDNRPVPVLTYGAQSGDVIHIPPSDVITVWDADGLQQVTRIGGDDRLTVVVSRPVASPPMFYAIDPDRDALPRCQVCGFGLDDLDAKWCVPCIDNAYQHADSYADRETVEWMQRVSVALARMQAPEFEQHRSGDTCDDTVGCYEPFAHQVTRDLDALLAEVERLRALIPPIDRVLQIEGSMVLHLGGRGKLTFDAVVLPFEPFPTVAP